MLQQKRVFSPTKYSRISNSGVGDRVGDIPTFFFFFPTFFPPTRGWKASWRSRGPTDEGEGKGKHHHLSLHSWVHQNGKYLISKGGKSVIAGGHGECMFPRVLGCGGS